MPFPSPVTMADVCPFTTAVMELMTVMIAVMRFNVAHLVSSCTLAILPRMNRTERGGLKKKAWVISIGKNIPFGLLICTPKAFRKLGDKYHS